MEGLTPLREVKKMLWSIKSWVRDTWHDFIMKQFWKLPFSLEYQLMEDFMKEQVKRGDGNYLHALINNFQKGIDKNPNP